MNWSDPSLVTEIIFGIVVVGLILLIILGIWELKIRLSDWRDRGIG